MEPPACKTEKKIPNLPIKAGSVVKFENNGSMCEGEVLLSLNSKKVLVQKQTRGFATLTLQDFDRDSLIVVGREYICNIGGRKLRCRVESKQNGKYRVEWNSKGEAVYVKKTELKHTGEQRRNTPEKENKKRKREPGTAPIQRKRLRQATPVMNSTPIGGSKSRSFLVTPNGRTQFATPTPKPKHITPSNMTPMGAQFQTLKQRVAMLEQQKQLSAQKHAHKERLWKEKCRTIRQEYEDSECSRKKELDEISELYEKKQQCISESFQKKLVEVEGTRQKLAIQVEEQKGLYEEMRKKLNSLEQEKQTLEEEKSLLAKSQNNNKQAIKIPAEILGPHTDKKSVMFRLKHIRYYDELVRWQDPKLKKSEYARKNKLKAPAFRTWFKSVSEETVIVEKDKLAQESKAALEVLQQEHSELQINFEVYKHESEESISSLTKELGNHKTASELQASLYEKVEQEKEEALKKLEALETSKGEEISELKKKIKAQLKDLKASQTAQSKFEKQVEEWKKKHSKANKEAQDAKERLMLMKTECAHLKSNNTKKKTTIERMRQDFDRQKAELDIDRKKNWDLQNKLDAKSKEIEKHRVSNVELQRLLDVEKRNAQNHESEKNLLNVQIQQLTREKEIQQENLEELNGKVERLMLKNKDSMTQKDLRELQNLFTELSYEAMTALKNRKKRK